MTSCCRASSVSVMAAAILPFISSRYSSSSVVGISNSLAASNFCAFGNSGINQISGNLIGNETLDRLIIAQSQQVLAAGFFGDDFQLRPVPLGLAEYEGFRPVVRIVHDQVHTAARIIQIARV